MTNKNPDDETTSFKIADEKIRYLLKRLADKNVCPCCTARALAFHAAALAEDTMGTTEAIERFEQLIRAMREDNVPAPEAMPSMQAH